MKEIRYSAKIQEQQTLSDAKGVGPETDTLKDKFKDGSIPLQIDFNQLIDIADVGRKACGQAPDQNGPGTGLKLNNDGTLNLKMGTIDSQDFSPLILEKDILSVDLGSGLINKTNGICVGQGNGIAVNKNDVAVKSKNSTIKVEPTGISVGMGWGVTVGGDGLDIVGSDGITVSAKGVAVKPYNGIISNSSGVSVKPYNGINVDSNGVSVKAGNGIIVNSSGVSVDPNTVLPTGIIVMFSGSSIPVGWALCDGSKGTPNLIDRFIMGGTIQNTHGKSSNIFSGNKDNKKFTFTSESQSVRISGQTEGHALTADENGKHNHEQGEILNETGMCHNGYTIDTSKRDWVNGGSTGGKPPKYRPYTFESGKGKPHSHNISLTSGQHSHNNNVTVPYYILAFIMKL